MRICYLDSAIPAKPPDDCGLRCHLAAAAQYTLSEISRRTVQSTYIIMSDDKCLLLILSHYVLEWFVTQWWITENEMPGIVPGIE